jgi:hypothetical protein
MGASVAGLAEERARVAREAQRRIEEQLALVDVSLRRSARQRLQDRSRRRVPAVPASRPLLQHWLSFAPALLLVLAA